MSRPWMPLYVADYLADTGHLSGAEHGAYLLLIMHYWQKGGLPDDDKRLASIARAMPEQWASMRATISEFFDEGWRHARIDAELKEAQEKYEKRAAAGREGGKAKANGKQSSSNAEAGLNQPQPPSHSSSKKEANASNAREFDDWYQHYPHKVQRGAAERAFIAARKIATLEELISGTKRYVASKPADYAWRNPATWLNGKGWLDAPASTAPRPHSTASPTGGSPKTFDEGGTGPRGQTKFLQQFETSKKAMQ